MDIAWNKILPVILSILIIIGVAILREYSKSLAAVVATMPINVPLALWIVYAAEGGEAESMTQFAQALFINIWPSMAFLLIVWWAARAGWGILPMLTAGYVGWAVGLGIIFMLRSMRG